MAQTLLFLYTLNFSDRIDDAYPISESVSRLYLCCVNQCFEIGFFLTINKNVWIDLRFLNQVNAVFIVNRLDLKLFPEFVWPENIDLKHCCNLYTYTYIFELFWYNALCCHNFSM